MQQQISTGRRRAGAAASLTPAVWALIAFLVSRALILATGWVAVARVPLRPISPEKLDHRFDLPASRWWSHLFGRWANWDGQWFLRIAHDGYHRAYSEAFFPLYPLALRAVRAVTGVPWIIAGTIAAWAATAVALWLLYRMVAARFDPRIAAWTIAFLCFFPTSFYLTAVYSESLFLLLSVAAIYFGERRHWALAGLAGMLCVLTRNTGLLLVLPLAALMVEQDHARGVGAQVRALLRPRTLWLALIPAGLLGYMAYLQLAKGDALLYAEAQSHWQRALTWPFVTVARATQIFVRSAWSNATSLRMLSSLGPGGVGERVVLRTIAPWITLVGWAGVSLAAVRRLPPAYTIWSLALLVFPLCFPTAGEPLMSLTRFALLAFPLFVAAAVLTRGRRVTRLVLLTLSGALLVWMAATFALWWFVA